MPKERFKNRSNPLYWYVTLGPIGYLPASGTLATLLTMSGLFFTSLSYSWLILLILTSSLYGFFVINSLLKKTTHKDPSYVVLDEVIGSLITLYAVPLTMGWCVMGFFLFRFFDISKWGPIGWAEKIKGSSGILLDDIIAGVVSNIILQLLLLL